MFDSLTALAMDPPEGSSPTSKTWTRSLPIDTYKFWFDAIKSNDEQRVKEFLSAKDDQEKGDMLNGAFDFQEDDAQLELGRSTGFVINKPFTIAIVSGCYEVAAMLIAAGADAASLESNQSNLVHNMVLVSFYSCDAEVDDSLVTGYKHVTESVHKDVLKELLMTENPDGLRPIELAAHKGCIKLLRAIIETRGVYLIKEEMCGLLLYQWFDVTDYEGTVWNVRNNKSRAGKSPLALLSYMKEDVMEKEDTRELIEWEPFKQWIDRKFQCNKPLICLWFLFRSFMAICFLLMLSDESLAATIQTKRQKEMTLNYTLSYCHGYTGISMHPAVRATIATYVTILALCVVIYDVLEVCVVFYKKAPFVMHNTALRRGLAIEHHFFRFCQLAMATSLVMSGFGVGLGDAMLGTAAVYMMNLLTSIFACWGLLYFIQLLPTIGFFVVTIQRMLVDLLNFTIIAVLFLAPLAHFFLVFLNMDTLQGCIINFQDTASAMYSGFSMMLNMEGVREYHVMNPAVLQILHIFFVFVVAILLLNFLIANLSISAAKVYDNQKVLLTVERLSVCHLLEFRLGTFMSRYFRWRKKRLFFMVWDRLCVTDVTILNYPSEREPYLAEVEAENVSDVSENP